MRSNPDSPHARPATLINLQLGWPSPRLFASAGLLEGATEVLSSESETAAALIYGPHVGHPPLRKSVAEWLSSVYSTQISHERICISNGASGNLANVLQKFTDPLYTRRIFMVEPTYFLACPIFEDNGFQGKMRGVPETNEDGVDLGFLSHELAASEAQAEQAVQASSKPDTPTLKTGKVYPKIYKYIIYLVPTFSNPSGKTISLRARQELVSLARQYDALIISDDVYDFLSWSEHTSAPDDAVAYVPPRLVDVDREMTGYGEWGNTISNGSFSKVIGPGVRVGWSECTPAFARELAEVGSSSSGGAPSHLTSTFVDKMLRSGRLQSHIRDTLIPTYRHRYYVMMATIQNVLVPLGVKVEASRPRKTTSSTVGGFFTYLRLPDDLPEARIVAAVAFRDLALRIAFGHMFTVTGDTLSIERSEANGGFARCVRLCWAWHEEKEIVDGVKRLAETIIEIRERISRGESMGDLSIGIR